MLGAEGQLIDNKYEIIRRLATGGMGDVYLVRHQLLQERRVVKVIRQDLAADAVALERFKQEARVATQIRNQHVAALFDYSILPDGRYYMVWEYIEGHDLGERIRERGPIAPVEAASLAAQALRGLGAIHRAGVVHRDVSPDNIMLTTGVDGEDVVKIIDLGLVKEVAGGLELTQAGTFMGKFRYCSPEQAGYLKEGSLDARSDLYSLAQVIYEMVTGLPPFDSESQHGFVLKRLTELPLPVESRNPEVDLPGDLGTVIMKGLERDRDARYADAKAFRKALEQAIERLQRREAPAAAVPKAPVPRPTSSPAVAGVDRRIGKELTKDERNQLLAQIERAGAKGSLAAKRLDKAERALKDGRFEEARELVEKIRATDPVLDGLEQLDTRLRDAESIARRRQQVVQAEQMLEKYMLERQEVLARMALEALLDLYPNHPKRSDYESWVGMLADEAAQQKKAEAAFRTGRDALTRDDVDEARRQLEVVEELDLSGQLAGSLMSAVQTWEEENRRALDLDALRAEVERHLSAARFDDARAAVARLRDAGLARVTVDLMAARVAEVESATVLSDRTESLEAAFRAALARKAWDEARAVAHAFAEADPASSRPGEMLGEISRSEGAASRDQGMVDGLRSFDQYLAKGQFDLAAAALMVLKRMSPNDPRVDAAEARLEQRRRG